MVSKEKARMKTLPCCWATKSCSRLTGSRVGSLTATSQGSRSPLPGQQDRRPDETGDDAEKVKHPNAHESVERIRVGERPQWTHVRVHDSVEHRMEYPAEDSAQSRDRQSIFGGERFGDDVSWSRDPRPHPRYDQPADETDESAEKERVRLPVDRVITVQQVVARLDVDDDLGERIRRHRELTWHRGLDEQAGTEMKGRCRHGMLPIYPVSDVYDQQIP